MARRRRYSGFRKSRRYSRGGGMSKMLLKGIVPFGGVLGIAAAAGLGYFSAEVANMIPIQSNLKQPAVAVAGGAAGVAGMLARNMTGGASTGAGVGY